MGNWFGGGSKTQTTKSRQRMYEPTKAGIDTAIGQISNIGADPTNFMTQYSPESTANLAAAQQFAGSPTSVSQYLQPTIQGYTDAGLNAALPGMVEAATGPVDPMSNPYYAAMRDRLATDISQNVNAAASGAGRYGSGMHTGVLTDRLAGGLGAMDYQAYSDAQTRQDAIRDQLARYGIGLAGQSGQLDEAQLRKLALGQQVGGIYDQRLNDPRLAQMRAPEWTTSMLGPLAQTFGQKSSKTTEETHTPIGNQILGAAMSLGSMAMGLPPGVGASFGSLLGGGGSNYGLMNEAVGAAGGQPTLGGKPLYGPF